MNGMSEESSTGWKEEQPEARPVAFCQSCGKALHQETVRIVGPAVYCEPCLAARLAGATPAASYVPVPPYSAVDGTAPSSWAPPPPPVLPDQSNPGIAALLGFLPGVGAMYNGQYAKGIVHLIVFAVLISLAHVNGLFGLFIAGWIFYMVIEAHHTAKARRDGTPLPNPFGLNDIGERLGFGRAWAAGSPASAPDVAAVAQDAARAAAEAFRTASTPPSAPQPYAYAPNWGAPGNSYAPPYAAGPQAYSSPYAPGYAPGSPFTPPIMPAVAPSRFPTGAVWLIGLGIIFLLSTTGLFHGVFGPALVGFAVIGLSIFVFVRRMTDSGASLASDGTGAYRLRVLRALKGSIWLLVIGVLFLLNTFDLLTWHRSWPIVLIAFGVMALLDRIAYSSVAAETFTPTQPPAYPQGFSSPAATPPSPAATPPSPAATAPEPAAAHGSDTPHDRDVPQGGD